MNVFWRFFASFFVLILVPSIIACLFTYIFVIKLIEQEVENSSSILIGHFAEKTDEMIGTLQDDMIGLLSYADLHRFVHYQKGPADDPVRIELLKGLNNQLNALAASNPLVDRIFLYHVDQRFVISDSGGLLDQDVFFDYFNHYEDLTSAELEGLFTGRKMMDFTQPLTIANRNLYTQRNTYADEYLSAVMSYPFNSPRPDLYLVANINAQALQEQIAIRHSDAIETAIVDTQGSVLAYAGQRPGIEAQVLLNSYPQDADQETIRVETANGESLQVTYNASERYDWLYIGMADLDALLQPAKWIQRASILLLLFFFVTGALLSLFMSRRMAEPIVSIKRGLENGRRKSSDTPLPEGDELAMIRHWSHLLMSEHKDMEELISGMSPVMHEYFLGKVLSGEFRDQLSIEYYTREIRFDVRSPERLAVLGISLAFRRSESEREMTETDKSFLITELKEAIDRRLPEPAWYCRMGPDLIACIIHLPQAPDAAAALLEQAKHIRQVLLALSQGRYHAAIGIGQIVDALWELHASYRHAERLLRNKGLHDGVEICLDRGDWEEERLGFDSFLSADDVSELLLLYRQGKQEELLDRVFALLQQGIASHASAVELKQLAADILNTWLRAVPGAQTNELGIEQYAILYQRLQACATVEELQDFFVQTAAELVAAPRFEEGDRFEEVAAYIREHYAADLGIESFAQQMNMSVGHFSRRFKETMGEKYIEYITRCRLEAAKCLLRDSDDKIDEIAEKVGYLGRHSFIKTFRKYEGLTPGKYREANR